MEFDSMMLFYKWVYTGYVGHTASYSVHTGRCFYRGISAVN